MTFFPLFLAAAGVLVAPVPAAKPDANPAALEKKLHGSWVGRGPCDGTLVLAADGTYRRERHGPAGNTSAGTWKVRWDALPPTLVLTCTTSDDASRVRTAEVKLTRLDDQGLAFTTPNAPNTTKPTTYLRADK